MLAGWETAKRLTLLIDGTGLSSDLIDFPVLVNLSASSGLNGYDCTAVFAELGGSSLKIAIEDLATGAECYVEVARWDATAQSAQLWVRAPRIAAGGSTKLALYYDAAHADNTAHVGATGSAPAAAVWSNGYAAVWHLGVDPSGGSIADSVGNVNLTVNGGMGAGNVVAGPVGKALSFDGVDDWLRGDGLCPLVSGGDLTIDVQMRTPGGYSATWGRLAGFNSNDGVENPLLFSVNGATGEISVYDQPTDHYAATSGVTDDVWRTFSISRALTGDTRLYIDAAEDTGGDFPFASVNDVPSDGRFSIAQEWDTTSNSDFFKGAIALIAVSTVARGADWVRTFHRAAVDQLLTIGELAQVRASCVQPYGDAPVARAACVQPYDDAARPLGVCAQPYGDARPARGVCKQPYGIAASARGVCRQPYAVCGSRPVGVCRQAWDLRPGDPVRGVCAQPWAMPAGAALRQAVEVSARIGSVSVEPAAVEISGSLDQYCLSCELTVLEHAAWLAAARWTPVTVTVDATTFALVVESRGRDAEHGTSAYRISCVSPAARLDAPWSSPISGDLGPGMASGIAGALAAAAGVTLVWSVVDWHIPAATLFASDEPPIAILRRLAATVGGVLQSAPDGSLHVIPEYPVQPSEWATAQPAAWLSADDNVFRLSERFDPRDVINEVLVTDRAVDMADGRLEVEEVSPAMYLVRGWTVPAPAAPVATLRTTAGDWVSIEPLGVEEMEKTEEIEIVAGGGSVAYPVAEVVSHRWLETDLGGVTVTADGSVTADEPAESLLRLTYRTACHLWRVRGTRIGPAQLVMEKDG